MNHLPLMAWVSPPERAVVSACATHLITALGRDWTCTPAFVTDEADLERAPPGTIRLTSMLSALDQFETPWPIEDARLRRLYARLSDGGDPVLICTILRHVADHQDAPQLRVRIRRLNLLATELSREYGAFIIDIDRVLADIGARRLQTDYRLRGPAATDVAAKAMALGLVTNALDDHAPFEIQDKARAVILSYQPAIGLAPDIAPRNLMTLGQGRRRQVVSTITDTVQENHVGWLVGQVMKGQIGPGEALNRLVQAVQRRGAKESLTLLTSGIARLIGRRS